MSDLRQALASDEVQWRIARWVVPIMGYTQTTERPTGLEKLWRKLRDLKRDNAVVMTPHEWNANWRAVAGLIARNSTLAPYLPTIQIVAYSWGAGWGAMQLARALDAHGLVVRTMVLADPVYRSPRLWMRWRSLVNLAPCLTPAITVPGNVAEVHWTRQRTNRPCAHDLKAEDKGTRINPCVLLSLKHSQMDDSAAFHKLALDALGA